MTISVVRVSTNSRGVVEWEYNTGKNFMLALPVVGTLNQDRVAFGIQTSKAEMMVKYVPKEPGLYAIRLSAGDMNSEEIPFVKTDPVFSIPDKNHDLLTTEQLKENLLKGNYSRQRTIVFYAK